METRADILRATVLSVGLHLGLLGLLFVSLLFQRQVPSLSVAGGAIEAVLIETLTPPAALLQAPPAAPAARPQPRPEPRPQTATEAQQMAPQETLAKPDVVDQERIVREAAQQAEEAQRIQEERRRQEQVQLEEEQRQQEAERRQRLAREQAARDQELAEIRRQREAAEERRRREAEKLQQLEDLREQAQAGSSSAAASSAGSAQAAGNQGQDQALQARYVLAIQQQVDRNWLRPDNLQPGLRCYIEVTQVAGGQVTGMDFARCQTDEITRRSIEASLMREPLPYRGYESVFVRKLIIPFCYPIEVCAQ